MTSIKYRAFLNDLSRVTELGKEIKFINSDVYLCVQFEASFFFLCTRKY